MNQVLSIRRYIIVNTSIVLLGLAVNQTIQTLGGVVMARVLPNSTLFGEVNLLQQILGMSGLFLNLGLNSALTFQLSRSSDGASDGNFGITYYASSVVGLAVAGILISLSGVFARVYGVEPLKWGLVAGAGLVIFNSMVNVVISFFAGKRDFTMQSTFMVVTTGLSIGGVLFGIWKGGSGDGLFLHLGLGMTAAAALAALASGWMVRHRYHTTFKLALGWKTELSGMLRYGIPMWSGNLAKAFQQPFLVMVTGAVSVVAAGYLSNALRVVGYLNIVTWAFNVTSLPFLAQTSKDPRQSYMRATLGFRYNNLLLFSLTAITCAFPHAIALALFGQRYAGADATQYIRVLGIGILFSSVSRLGGTMMAGLGRTRANFWTMVVSGVIVLVMAPLFVRHQPVLGAWIFTIGWGLSAVATIFFCRLDGLWMNWRIAFIEPFEASFLLLLVLMLRMLFHGPLLALLIFTVAIVGFGVLTWRTELRISHVNPAWLKVGAK